METQSTSDSVLVSREGAVELLTLNRPDKLNALNRTLMDSLVTALTRADSDPGVSLIVLTGAGRAFCAGADLADLKTMAGKSASDQLDHANTTMRLFGIIPKMSKPVIGAINGLALGGGFGLAMACDMAIVTRSAKLGYPEVKNGALPAVVMANLVRQIGRKPAFELVALGEFVDPQKALALGIVNRVVDDGTALSETMAIAKTMAGFDRNTLSAIKTLFYRVADQPLDAALGITRDFNMLMRAFRKSND
jgi:enoyl-CoA hydratase/carnithine racemase